MINLIRSIIYYYSNYQCLIINYLINLVLLNQLHQLILLFLKFYCYLNLKFEYSKICLNFLFFKVVNLSLELKCFVNLRRYILSFLYPFILLILFRKIFFIFYFKLTTKYLNFYINFSLLNIDYKNKNIVWKYLYV